MARRDVIEVVCDRCPRVEHRTKPAALGVPDREVPAFTGTLADGGTVTFVDLCAPCLRAVRSHLDAIGKKLDGMSPDRVAKANEVAPSETETPEAPPSIEKKPPVTKSLIPAPEVRK